jgi:cytochrome b
MNTIRTRVWDLPTRVFHWLLVACIVGSIVSVSIGGNATGWHFRFGYAIFALVLFRILWGFVGPRYARFSSFPPSPSAAIAYLRGNAPPRAGHNPLGAFSVYALLVALCVQVATGLFANDDIMWEGPLRNMVSNATSDLLTRAHRLNRFIVFALIIAHLGAIAYYALVKKEGLVKAMIDGDRDLDPLPAHPPAQDSPRVRTTALAVLGVSVLLVWWAVTQLR